MNCTKSRKLVSLAVDGRLPYRLQKDLEVHLEKCPACRSWYEQQQEISGFLSEPIEDTLSPFFADRLRQRIRSHRATPKHSFPSLPGFRRLAYGSIMLLMFLLAALAGMQFSTSSLQPAESNRDLAFTRTLELELFADMPSESFGAVYTSLIRGVER